MLKKILNHALITLKLTPLDPLLIKSGQATVAGVNMSFVRTYRFGEQDQPYMPGSSLKGVIRSYAEKICRSLRIDPVPVCLPYLEPGKEQPGESRQTSCGIRFDKMKKDRQLSSEEIYRLSCPICRLFGSLGFTGRFSISDAYVQGPHLLETRDGVAIDRITGGAAPRAKYDLEVLTRGTFETTIELRNFERWQLGLVALVLREMEEGLVRVGSGKSRGLGRIKAEIGKFDLIYFNRDVPHLTGLYGICNDNERKAYEIFPEIPTPGKGSLPDVTVHGLRHKYDIAASWKETVEPAVGDLIEFIRKVNWPRNLEQAAGGKM